MTVFDRFYQKSLISAADGAYGQSVPSNLTLRTDIMQAVSARVTSFINPRIYETSDGNFIIAFRGTNPLDEFDRKADAQIFAGKGIAQSGLDAAEYGREVVEFIRGNIQGGATIPIMFTGHSKGGYDAMFAAFTLNSTQYGSSELIGAVAYNAPGFDRNALSLYGYHPDDQPNNIANFYTRSDFANSVTRAQGAVFPGQAEISGQPPIPLTACALN